jgi:hypothetical protein
MTDFIGVVLACRRDAGYGPTVINEFSWIASNGWCLIVPDAFTSLAFVKADSLAAPGIKH